MLREIALQKGYLYEDTKTHSITHPTLDMPQLSKESALGLLRTFPLYVKMPKDRYDEIKIAEQFTIEGNSMFAKLAVEYSKNYW
jgi:hypothetical protein